MNPEPCTVSRVLVTIDEGRVRTKVQLPTRKETTTMNYRDFNPNQSCLPAEAYPYLWAAVAAANQPRPSLWGRIAAIFRQVALPVICAAVFLPLADPPQEHLVPLRVRHQGGVPDHNSLVWVQPNAGVSHPQTLPRYVTGNPYSL